MTVAATGCTEAAACHLVMAEEEAAYPVHSDRCQPVLTVHSLILRKGVQKAGVIHLPAAAGHPVVLAAAAADRLAAAAVVEEEEIKSLRFR